MRLGIDIDGTVTAPETFVPYLNKSYNMSITLEDIKDYDLTKVLKVSEEELGKWMDEYEPMIYKESPLSIGAKEVLDKWKEDHTLIFITARRKHLKDVTYEWFHQHDIHYHDIELVGAHDKLEAVQKHKIDIFFEDKHDNAVMISGKFKIPVILFNTPYNQDPIPELVIRVNNWREAQEWVENWMKTKGDSK